MKKLIPLLLSIVLTFSFLCALPIVTVADTVSTTTGAKYHGKLDSATDAEFEIYSVDQTANTFTGHLKCTDSMQTNEYDVSGTIMFYDNYYLCNFSFNCHFAFFGTYNVNVDLKMDYNTGKATGKAVGGLFFGLTDAELFKDYDYLISKEEINDDDLILCMELSNAMYGKNNDEGTLKRIKAVLDSKEIQYGKLEDIVVENYEDANGDEDQNKDNAPYAIMKRENSSGSVDIIVSIRGTYNAEWQGNVEITGISYDASMTVHDNFNKAKESIRAGIKEYYESYADDYDEINLIITGHSRGAAVANLYAKEATDVMNNAATITDVPRFDNVTAYTFACPNVEKVTDGTAASLESYDNIMNFAFISDVVPSVPLTNPIEGWNYWKYGKNYVMDISTRESECDDYGLLGKMGNINNNSAKELNEAFSFWPDVDAYYNKQLYKDNGDYTTLFDTLHTTLFLKAGKIPTGLKGIIHIIGTPELKSLASVAASNASNIVKSHSNETYNNIITKYGSEYFRQIRYCDVVEDNNSALAVSTLIENEDIIYNQDEMDSLLDFYAFGDNSDKLNWNTSDPSSWNGITWDTNGHVIGIDFMYKWLSGSLDCSNYTELTSLNVYANLLSSINVSNNTYLTYLNCEYNDLSENGLNLSNCIALKEIYCDGCALSSLNLSNLNQLEVLSCDLNELTDLDLVNCTNLTSIGCMYNYLDVHIGSDLYNQFINFANDGVYVNYKLQLIPENANTNDDEMLALEQFAHISNNNDSLEWLDDNEDISAESVQCNAIFEYYNNEYRIIGLDVTDLDVVGELDLSDFAYLRYLYCNNTKITALDVSGCTNLETLHCENSEISSLTLPINANTSASKLSCVECENNHIDINIFTPDIINCIESKDNYTLTYRHQIISQDISAFDAYEYRTFYDFANQNGNNEILKWDLDNPGSWDEVNWILDLETNKYKALDCSICYLDVGGAIDLSSCDKLDRLDFSGTDIEEVSLPNRSISNGEFYHCSNLESVFLNGGTAIEEKAFKNCSALNIAFITDSITSIGNDAFLGCGIETVYYEGSASDWNNISIGSGNESLTNAQIIYNHTHSYGNYQYNGNATMTIDGTATRECSICSFKDNKLIEGTSSLRCSSYDVSLEYSSNVNYTLMKSNIPNGWTLNSVKVTRETKVTDITNIRTETEEAYTYTYDGTIPQCYGDDVSVSVYATTEDGIQVWGPAYEKGIKTYISSTLSTLETATEPKDIAFRTLLVDALYYGEAAQKYEGYKLNDLCTKDLTEAQRSWASDNLTEFVTVKDTYYQTIEEPDVEWYATSLLLVNSVRPKMLFRTIDGSYLNGCYSVVVDVEGGNHYTYNSVDNPECFVYIGEKDGKQCYGFYFNNLSNTELSTRFTIQVYKDSVPISDVMAYSAESYVYSKNNSSTDDALNYLCNRMMVFGKSAVAYANCCDN